MTVEEKYQKEIEFIKTAANLAILHTETKCDVKFALTNVEDIPHAIVANDMNTYESHIAFDLEEIKVKMDRLIKSNSALEIHDALDSTRDEIIEFCKL